MKKAEILSLLDNVIANCDKEKATTETPMNYLKLDIRRSVYVEVREFLNEKLADEKDTATKKA